MEIRGESQHLQGSIKEHHNLLHGFRDFHLKPWPVRIFEDFPFSLYIVTVSESDEGLVI